MGNKQSIKGGSGDAPVDPRKHQPVVYHFMWLNKDPVPRGQALISGEHLGHLRRWAEDKAAYEHLTIALWVDPQDGGSIEATRAAVPKDVQVLNARIIDAYCTVAGTLKALASKYPEEATPIRCVYARVDYLKLCIMRVVFAGVLGSPELGRAHYVCDLDVRTLKDPELQAPNWPGAFRLSRLSRFGFLFAAKELSDNCLDVENGWAGALSYRNFDDAQVAQVKNFYVLWASLSEARLRASRGSDVGSVVYVSLLQALAHHAAVINGHNLVVRLEHKDKSGARYVKYDPKVEAAESFEAFERLVITGEPCTVDHDGDRVKLLMRPPRVGLEPAPAGPEGRETFRLVDEVGAPEVRPLGAMPYEQVPVWEIRCFAMTGGDYL